MIEQEKTDGSKPVEFTTHQVAIIQAWATHGSTVEAAAKLSISEHTMLTHLKRMRAKLQVHRTFDVYRYMMQQGWVE